jgi:hypothetical protein
MYLFLLIKDDYIFKNYLFYIYFDMFIYLFNMLFAKRYLLCTLIIIYSLLVT